MIKSHVFEVRTSDTPHTLFIGDSIIRFLANEFPFTQVMAFGGNKVRDIHFQLNRVFLGISPRLLIIHVAINNVNQRHCDEYSQMSACKHEIKALDQFLVGQQGDMGFAVIVSGVVQTNGLV